MKNIALVLFLAACPSNPPPGPDAGLEEGHYEGDGHGHAVPPDASRAAPDASPDATEPCWQYKTYQCGDVIYNICIPYTGCSFFECDGSSLGYCGPGGL